MDAVPAKIEYTEGETLDPEGLMLHVYYSDDTEGSIGYNAGTAEWFAFTPDLGTALTTDVKEVTVTYQNHTVTFGITVNEKDPGTKPEDPQKPGTGGSGNGGSQTGNGGKAVQTGDTANYAVWGAAVILAGAAVVIAGKKRRSEK